MNPNLVKLLAELSALSPDMRLGQLVEMLVSFAEQESDVGLQAAGADHLARRMGQLGLSPLDLSERTLSAARADLLAELRRSGSGVVPTMVEWADVAGCRLYEAEDEQLLAAARSPVRLGDWLARAVSVGEPVA